ncbi:LysR family transcriptional regulator [Aneurinibacillus sp. REN35]|uniref:LysR family transcriptional regulator n=1 Tax=Aneurinibacillus sp. REN35 TaxID=3237286 RepID=UPI0035279952
MLAINLVYLETFLAVHEHGNFTEAAKHLYVPQPTVTNRIRHLEDELGQPLFTRGKAGKRNVQLTAAGDIFLPYVKQVLTSLDNARRHVTAANEQNLVKVGSSIPFTHPFIVDKVKSLYAMNNDVNISLSFIKNSILSHRLIDNTIDLAFSTEPLTEENFTSCTLGSEEFELILPSEHPLSAHAYIEDITLLQDESLICYEPYMKYMEEHIRTEQFFKKKLMSNQLGIIRNLLKHNYGIAFLPPLLLAHEINNGWLVSVPFHSDMSLGKIHYSLIYKKDQPIYKEVLYSHS